MIAFHVLLPWLGSTAVSDRDHYSRECIDYVCLCLNMLINCFRDYMMSEPAGQLYTINSVKVQFPCKAYPSQLSMMDKVHISIDLHVSYI